MSPSDTAIAKARELLRPEEPKQGALGALAAAGLLAMSAVLMAGVMVLGPGLALDPPARTAGTT